MRMRQRERKRESERERERDSEGERERERERKQKRQGTILVKYPILHCVTKMISVASYHGRPYFLFVQFP